MEIGSSSASLRFTAQNCSSLIAAESGRGTDYLHFELPPLEPAPDSAPLD